MPGYVQRLKRLEKRLNKLEGILDKALPFSLVASSVVDIERTGVWYNMLWGFTEYEHSGEPQRIAEGGSISYYIVSQFGIMNGSIVNLAVGLALSAGISFGLYKVYGHLLESAYRRMDAGEDRKVPSIVKKVPMYVFLAGATVARIMGATSWPL